MVYIIVLAWCYPYGKIVSYYYNIAPTTIETFNAPEGLATTQKKKSPNKFLVQFDYKQCLKKIKIWTPSQR